MRRVLLFDEITLDGCFEGRKNWDLDFGHPADREIVAYTQQLNQESGAMLLGRVTYEGLAAYFPTQKTRFAKVLNDLPKIVFSRTLKEATWSNTTIERRRPEIAVRELKRQPGKDLQISGSGMLAARLRKYGLIDEYHLWLNPTVLGRGRPLFPPSSTRTAMRFVEVRLLKSGRILLRCAPRAWV
jgi:dihydrofolate reductase